MAKVAPECPPFPPPPPPLPPPSNPPPSHPQPSRSLARSQTLQPVPFKALQYALSPSEVKLRDVEPGSSDDSESQWMHGEILFEETGQVCKYLIIPEHVTDPMDVVSCLFTKWCMKRPNMVCNVASGIGNYMHHDRQDIDTNELDEEDYPDISLRSLLREQANNWDDKGRYEQTVMDIMYGVCAAESECGGWLLGKRCCRWGSSKSGAVFSEGCRNFYASRPTKRNSLTFLCASGCDKVQRHQYGTLHGGLHELSHWVGMDMNSGLTAKQLRTSLFFPFEEPQDLAADDLAVPIGEPVQKRLHYPFVKWDEKVEWPEDSPGAKMGFTKPHRHHDILGYATLNPYCTHLLIGDKVALEAIDLLQAIFPSVFAVLDFKGPTQMHYNMAFAAASRGATVLLMQNMGISVNVFVKALKDRQSSMASDGELSSPSGGKHKDEEVLVPLQQDGNPLFTCQVPDGTALNKFLIFDALTVSRDTVIDKLTKALTVMAGDNFHELNHSQNEKERIIQAWGFHMKLRYNAIRYKQRGFLLHICIAVVSFSTSSLAVLFTAGNLKSSSDAGIAGVRVNPEIDMSSQTRAFLAFTCAVLPLASTFLLSCSTKFNFDNKYCTLMSTAVKIQGEIYKYRTKSGIYQPRSRNEALDTILNLRLPASDAAGGVEPPRKLFSNQVTSMVQKARTAITLSSLKEPSQAFKSEVTNSLVSNSSKHTLYVEYEQRGCCSRRSKPKGKHPLWDIENVEAAGLDTNQEESHDDGILVITAEDYVKMRLQPSIRRMQVVLPQRSFWFTCSQIIVVVSTLMSGVLGFLGLNTYIPISAAMASAVESVSSYTRLKDRLTATNTALTELQSLLVWYRGLSMVERRLLHNKNHLVDVTEAALVAELGVISSGHGDAKPVVPEDADDGDDKDTEKKRDNDKGAEKKRA